MLIFMTFSVSIHRQWVYPSQVWLGLSVCGGIAIGYFIFGSREWDINSVKHICVTRSGYYHCYSFFLLVVIIVRHSGWCRWMDRWWRCTCILGSQNILYSDSGWHPHRQVSTTYPSTLIPIPAYVFSCLAVGVIAFVYETVNIARLHYFMPVDDCCAIVDERWEITEDVSETTTEQGRFGYSALTVYTEWMRSMPRNQFTIKHIIASISLFLQLLVSYSLMMIAMTYNVPIILSLVIGEWSFIH